MLADWQYAAFEQDGPLLAQWASENEFDGRAYKDPETGLTYPSVTTVLRNTPKADLMGWAAMKVAERARDRPDIVLGDPDRVVQRLQYAHTDFRDERGWIGSRVHKAVEADLRGIWWSPDEPFISEENAMIEAFDSFKAMYAVEPVLTECTIIGDGYMGTLDGLWSISDPWTGDHIADALVDVKSSKRIWDEHRMQLAALANATHYFEQVESDGLVHKHPKLGKTFWKKHEGLPDFSEVRILQLRAEGYTWKPVVNIDLWYKKFRVYLDLWNVDQEIKLKEKESGF